MNTKQKLTLGIAAIFMVTLTIVGVTYAYFVTQVTGDNGTQNVDITTASFGNLKYVSQGDTLITLADVHPGDEAKTLLFSVENDGESALNYQLTLEVTGVPTDKSIPQYIRTMTSSDGGERPDSCYVDGYRNIAGIDTTALSEIDGAVMPDACLTGTYFDNIEVVVYESDASRTKGTPVYGSAAQAKKLKNDDSYSITTDLTIPGLSTGEKGIFYLVEVKYVDAEKNQNFETNATLTIKPNITNVSNTLES